MENHEMVTEEDIISLIQTLRNNEYEPENSSKSTNNDSDGKHFNEIQVETPRKCSFSTKTKPDDDKNDDEDDDDWLEF